MLGFRMDEFISSRTNANLQKRLQEQGMGGQNTTLICGEPCSGKSSILFHYAYNLATQGKTCTFMADKEKIDHLPPFLPEGVTKEDAAYDSVQMKYLSTSAEIRMYCACFHLLPRFPDALIVDDIDSSVNKTIGENVFKARFEKELIGTLAALTEAARYASQRKGSPCKLVFSCGKDSGINNMYIYQQWCQLALQTAGDVTQGYKLTVIPNPHTDSVSAQFLQTKLIYNMLAGCLSLTQVLD